MIRKAAGAMVLFMVCAAFAAAPAWAQAQEPAPSGPQTFPVVANLDPFSPEANFMSLVGYLRWLVFQQTGEWLSNSEAARIVNEQRTASQ
jgi:hypothetical protein